MHAAFVCVCVCVCMCVCKSVCLKTLELIKGFSMVWCFVCSSQLSKFEVILQLKLFRLFAKSGCIILIAKALELSHSRKSHRCGKRFNKLTVLLVFMPAHSGCDLIQMYSRLRYTLQ